jgi:hypothetical protein
MFEREDWTMFRELSRLGQRAGVPLASLPGLILKELVDNALDVTGAKGFRIGQIPGRSAFFVEDGGPGIDGRVAALFSINRPLTSTKLLRRV